MKPLLTIAFAVTLCVSASCGHDRKGPRSADCQSAPEDDAACTGLGLLTNHFYEDNPTYTDRTPDDGFFKVSTPEAEKMDAKLLAAGERELEATPQIFSLLVLRGGYLVEERYFHGSSAEASNNIHSASKGILSMLAGIALDKGVLRGLDEKVGDMLPDYRLNGKKAGINLRDLLTMAGGFKWEEDDTEYKIEKRPDWVQSILDLPLATAPGSEFNYSTGQSHLVSAILSQATGLSTREFAEQNLFAPLNINIQHWGSDPQGINSGGYNLYMTARSLAKIGMLARNHGRVGDRQIVPEAWLEEAWRPAKTVDDDWRYGYYWWLTTMDGHEVRKLWGFGGQLVYLVPDFDLVVVMTTNTHDDFEEYDGDPFLAKYILPAIQGANAS